MEQAERIMYDRSEGAASYRGVRLYVWGAFFSEMNPALLGDMPRQEAAHLCYQVHRALNFCLKVECGLKKHRCIYSFFFPFLFFQGADVRQPRLMNMGKIFVN